MHGKSDDEWYRFKIRWLIALALPERRSGGVLCWTTRRYNWGCNSVRLGRRVWGFIGRRPTPPEVVENGRMIRVGAEKEPWASSRTAGFQHVGHSVGETKLALTLPDPACIELQQLLRSLPNLRSRKYNRGLKFTEILILMLQFMFSRKFINNRWSKIIWQEIANLNEDGYEKYPI